MRYVVAPTLVLVLFFAIIYQVAFAGVLSCSITTSCPSGTVIYKMASTTNSHVGLPNYSSYPNLVCCTGVTGLSNSCSGNYVTVLKLASTTNSHAGENGVSSYSSSNNACMSVPSGATISAGYTSSGTCSAAGYNTTLGSMTSSNNSHVGSPNNYTIKICASAADPSLTFVTDSPTESFGTITPGSLAATTSILSAATTNTDGFNITIQRSNVTTLCFPDRITFQTRPIGWRQRPLQPRAMPRPRRPSRILSNSVFDWQVPTRRTTHPNGGG